jgi:exo-1,4-beta-D-glucosaminidase
MPLNLIYNYGNNQVYIVNDYLHSVNNLQARIRVYDINSIILFEKKIPINSTPDSSKSILQLDEVKDLTSAYFLDLRLFDSKQKEISSNFYWLSTKKEILDYEADLGEFAYHTPSKDYADLTLLNSLPKVKLESNHRFEKAKDNNIAIVEVKNTGDKIAFLINLKILDKISGEIILPVFWEDNYFSLVPGEEKTVSATFNSDCEIKLKIDGWNV